MSDADRADISSATPDAKLFALRNFAIGLAILVLASFTDVAFGGRSFFTRDFANFGYPLAHHVRESVRAGEIPLWNPYNLCGLPFLAQWNTLCLYPGSLIYILLPLPWSLNVFNLLHLYLGGLGMFCLARRWLSDGRAACVAGVGYAFGGVMISSLMWPNNIAALGWLPVALLTGERAARKGGRRWVTAAGVMALQFLAGSPEITALTWALLAALVLFGQESGRPSWRVRSQRLLVIVAATLGLTAIQLLPFLELLRLSQRGAQFATGEWTLTWPGLGNFLVPLFQTFRDRDGIFFQPAQQWVTSYYPGITIVFLALGAAASGRDRRMRLLLAAGAVSLALALGSHGFVYDGLRTILPGLGLMRYPIKFIVPVAVVLPLLAAFAARASIDHHRKTGNPMSRAVGLAMAALGLMAFSLWRPGPNESVGMTWRSGLIAVACLIALAGLLAATRCGSVGRRRWLPIVIAIVIYGDLTLANRHINPVVHPQVLTGRVATLEPRPAVGVSRAMVTDAAQQSLDAKIFTSPEAAAQIPRQALLLNANLIERVPKLDGFFSLYPPGPALLAAQLARSASAPAAQGLLDFLGVSHVNHTGQPWVWDRRTNWLPLLALVRRAVTLDPSQKYQPLLSEAFNPREQVFLPPEARPRSRTDESGRGRILPGRIDSHSIEAAVEADEPMWLTVAQTDYPGWRATLDGRKAAIWRANYAFQAIEIPAGRHEVKVFFRSSSFEIGAMISALSLVACVFAAWRPDRSRSKSSIPS